MFSSNSTIVLFPSGVLHDCVYYQLDVPQSTLYFRFLGGYYSSSRRMIEWKTNVKLVKTGSHAKPNAIEFTDPGGDKPSLLKLIFADYAEKCAVFKLWQDTEDIGCELLVADITRPPSNLCEKFLKKECPEESSYWNPFCIDRTHWEIMPLS